MAELDIVMVAEGIQGVALYNYNDNSKLESLGRLTSEGFPQNRQTGLHKIVLSEGGIGHNFV
jgi:hypothetical protein